MKPGNRTMRQSHPAGTLMLLAAIGALVPGLAGAMERGEQPAVARPARDLDAELAAAQETVRRSEEIARSRRRVGGDALREAQDDLVAARERLSALTAEAGNRRFREEQRQFVERQRREREREDARRAEGVREDQERNRRFEEEQRVAKERKDAERQRAGEEGLERMRRLGAEADEREAAKQGELRQHAEAIQREQAKPQNVLTRAYASYIQVKRCHGSLAGKAFVYVDDRELATARSQIKDVEAQLLRTDPGVDRDAAWRSAQNPGPTMLLFSNGGEDDVEAGVLSQRGQEYCRGALLAVRERYVGMNPEAGIVRKDF